MEVRFKELYMLTKEKVVTGLLTKHIICGINQFL